MKPFLVGMAFAEALTLTGFLFFAPFFDWILRHL